VAANKEKIDSYNELYLAYQETGEATEDLKKAAEELVEVYNIENGSIKIMTGHYKELTA
jgi:hypothetical protein